MKIALVLLSVLIAAPLRAQSLENRELFANYDIDSTSATYCLFSALKLGPARIQSSSTTVTAVSGTPFADVAVGDEIVGFNKDSPSGVTVYVTARASSTSITVDSAPSFDSGGVAFSYKTLSCGTGAGAGWFPVSQYVAKTVSFTVSQLDVTGGIDFIVDCRINGTKSGPQQIITGNYTSATYPNAGDTWPIPEQCDALRVGVKIGSADDGADTTTHQEKLAAYFVGERAK